MLLFIFLHTYTNFSTKGVTHVLYASTKNNDDCTYCVVSGCGKRATNKHQIISCTSRFDLLDLVEFLFLILSVDMSTYFVPEDGWIPAVGGKNS